MIPQAGFWHLVVGAVFCCLAGVTTPAAAAPRIVPYDFDGNGYADLAIGVPGDRAGGKDSAGAVNILYATDGGLRAKRAQLWSQATRGIKGRPTSYEGFGDIVASGDFDCDATADLAVGNDTKVAVLYGSRRGLTARDQLLPSGLGIFEGSAVLVERLTTGDFDDDGCSELAVAGEGHVAVLRGTPRGLSDPVKLALPAAVSTPDAFLGRGLVAGELTGDGIDDLAISGANRRTASGESGGVAVIPGSTRGLQPARTVRFGQEDPNIHRTGKRYYSYSFGDALSIGDFNGDRHGDLAIGDHRAGLEEATDDLGDPLYCPGESFCSGAVVILRGTPTGLSTKAAQIWTKSTLGAEHQVGFGTSLAAGDADGDGRDDLAVTEEWAVHLLRGSSAGVTTSGRQRWDFESPGIKGRDEFGSFSCGTVRLLNHGRGPGLDLSAGSQHYRNQSGAVNVIYGSPRGLTSSGDQLWRQNTRGVPGAAEDGDWFGGSNTCYVDTTG